MPTYTYKARDSAGKLVKGTIEASDKAELIDRLNKSGYMPIRVAEAIPGFKIESLFENIRGVSTEDMVMFNTQLSNMISAGISILVGLDTLNKQVENSALREALRSILTNVEAGDSLSQALARHPKIFPKIFISMIKAGEISGRLDTILARYSEFAERQADLKQKIQGALFYPVILLLAGIAVMLFIVTFIIPQFVEIFTKAGLGLPVPTLILYDIGTSIKHLWYSAVLFIIAGWFTLRYYAATDNGRLKLDALKLNLPLIGKLYRKSAIARFSRTLGTLVASGVPIMESLDIVKGVVDNEVLGRVISGTRTSVEKGEKIAQSLKISGEFPIDMIQMISVGEETGNLDGMLNKVADFYDLAVGYTIKKMTTLLEPIFLVIMGTMVGFIMMSMLLPIFDMVKVLRH